MVFQGRSCSRSKAGWSARRCTCYNSLNERGTHRACGKSKTRGKSEGRPWGASRYDFSNGKWFSGGYQLFLKESLFFCRDFRIGKPLVSESEIGRPDQFPAFWSCANKMTTCLLFQAERPEGHGIRPRSLNATTISTSMTEAIKGNANLSQLAIQ